jgi:O-antigen/teichoic acid export membrane protein
VVFLLILYRMDENHLGLFYFLVTLWNVLNVAIDFGGEQIATRETAKAPEREASILRDYVLCKTILAGLGAVVFVAVVWRWVDDPVHQRAFYYSLLVVPGLLFASFAVVFRVRHRMVWAAFAWIIAELVFLAIAVTALLTIEDDRRCFTALAIAVAVRLFLGGFGIFWFARRTANRPALRGARGDGPLGFFRNSWTQGIAGLSGILYFYIDTIMLKMMVGNDEVGLYNAAYRLLNFFVLAAGIIALTALPILSRAKSRERLQSVFRAVLSAMLLLAIPAASVGFALAAEMLTFLYREKMAIYHVSVPTLKILLVAGAFTYVGSLASLTLIAVRKQVMWTAVALAGLTFNISVNIVLIPRHGHVGAAWATLGTEALVSILCCGLLWRRRGITVSAHWLARAIPLGVATFFLAGALRDLWFPLAAGVAVGAFFGGVWVLRLWPRTLFGSALWEVPEEEA